MEHLRGRGGSVSLCLRSPKTKWVLRLLQCKLAKRVSLLLREIDSRHMGGGGGVGVGSWRDNPERDQ